MPNQWIFQIYVTYVCLLQFISGSMRLQFKNVVLAKKFSQIGLRFMLEFDVLDVSSTEL